MTALRLLPLVALALLLACGDDDASFDGGLDGSSDTGPIPCSSDLECSDGLYCNGEESCEMGECAAGVAPVCADELDCTVDVCNEVSDRCESTAPDLDDDGVGDQSCLDSDGEPLGADCDDMDPARFGGNVEVCDFGTDVDEDCNVDTAGTTDSDGDGFVDARCRNEGGANNGTDCNDGRADVNPLATEVCDGLDNDCDGNIDEGVLVAVAPDADRDGFPAEGMETMACPGLAGLVAVDADTVYDCDDADPTRNPGQVEICDLQDNDCDEGIDEDAEAVEWFRDLDGDGFGSRASGVVVSCEPVADASLLGTDCDDGDAGVNPGAAELCNALDDDCNGRADFLIGPGDFEDDDGDGKADLACGGPLGVDCDDMDRLTGEGTRERCDGRDNDCDGIVDEDTAESIWYYDGDGDGYGTDRSAANPPLLSCSPPGSYVESRTDCDDANPARAPGRRETCNGVDDDCDGSFDESPASCFCEAGTGDCDLNGSCETNTLNSALHCGACGNRCGAGQSCTAGLCTCAGDGIIQCDGACVDFTTSTEHCGGCGNRCGVGSSCERDSCSAIVDLDLGLRHSCLVYVNGTVVCWGDNRAGQVLPGSGVTSYARPVVVPVPIVATGVAVGVNFTCAVGEGSVRCWGNNDLGQLGFTAGMQPPGGYSNVAGLTGMFMSPYRVNVGADFACALTGSYEPPSQITCWGANARGQLGNGTTTGNIVGYTSGSGDALLLGDEFVCGVYQQIIGGGEINYMCWGANDAGQVGNSSTTDRLTPTSPSWLGGYFDFRASSGANHSCVRLTLSGNTDQDVLCWGENLALQQSAGDTMPVTTPTAIVRPPGNVQQVVLGGDRTCLVIDGTVWCRGDSAGGLASGTGWTRLPFGDSVASLQCGDEHCCAITDDQRLYCMGNGANGRLGTGVSAAATFLPRLVSDITP